MKNKIFSSAVSRHPDWQTGLKEVVTQVRKDLGRASCDLAVCFVSEAYESFDAKTFTQALGRLLPCRVLLGCNSSGVVGGSQEIEMEPAVTLMAMHLPEVNLQPFAIASEETTLITGGDLARLLEISPEEKPRFLCLADPQTTDITRLLRAFNEGYKDLPVVGGLASGSVLGKPGWLCLNEEVLTEGAAGVALTGDIDFDVIVSQGCRPIGQPCIITRAEENALYELAGRPAMEVIQELFDSLPLKDRALAEQSLSVGLVMNEHKASFQRGDFLIRNLMGFDQHTGKILVGAHLRVGQTLQFQIRDAQTASEDLKLLLEKMSVVSKGNKGGILVSCCGRGKDFFGHSGHDASMIQAMRGPLPLTGFFANGEIGPVGKKNFVHGYTSSLVILS